MSGLRWDSSTMFSYESEREVLGGQHLESACQLLPFLFLVASFGRGGWPFRIDVAWWNDRRLLGKPGEDIR